MPVLMYRRGDMGGKGRLYGKHAQKLKKSVFPDYRIYGRSLAYASGLDSCVARWWYLTNVDHTALAWINFEIGEGICIFVPGNKPLTETIQLARLEYPDYIPSPTIFRVKNEDKPYEWSV